MKEVCHFVIIESRNAYYQEEDLVPRTEFARERWSRTILLSLFLAISLHESAFAIRAYSTLYQDLKGHDAVIATVLSKHVDSISTVYIFRINERITAGIADSVIPVISFWGSRGGYAEAQRFDVGSKYLLLLYRGDSLFNSDPFRNEIYRQSKAFDALDSFPESRRDFKSAVEASKILITIRSLSDTIEVKNQFLKFLKSQNDFLIESAIDELKKFKDTRAISDLRRLSGSGSEMVRYLALTALREINGKEETPTFFKSLRDSSYLVRQRALQNLIWLKVVIPEDTLFQFVMNPTEESGNISLAAHQLLIDHSTHSIPILQKLLIAQPKNGELRRTLPRVIDSLKTFIKK